VSPDGRFLAYASDRGSTGNLNIWVRELTRDAMDRQITFDAADAHEPSFSSDSSRIAYRSERPDGGVFVIPTLGTPHPLSIEIVLHPAIRLKEGLAPDVECPSLTSQSTPLAMLVHCAWLCAASRLLSQVFDRLFAAGRFWICRKGQERPFRPSLLLTTLAYPLFVCGVTAQTFHFAGSKRS
jgi:hypothetical protein